MGSFNQTCGLSGISLAVGAKVKLFFIAENPWESRSNDPCYVWSRYTPISFGIDATYDDYGNYDFDEDCEAFKGLQNLIRTRGKKIEEGDNQYHDQSFDPSNPDHLTADSIMDRRHRIQIEHGKGENYKSSHITMFPILLDVWNEVVLTEKQGWQGDKFTVESMIPKRIKKIKDEDRSDQILALKELLKQYDEKSEALDESQAKHYNSIKSLVGGSYANISATALGLAIDEFHPSYPMDFHLKSAGVEWLAEAGAEVTMWHYTMLQANRPIMPTMGSGQDHRYDEQALILQGCADVASRLYKEEREEYEREEAEYANS